ncbi:hypothetical protein C5Z26_11060 [Lactobacillus sp. CBA3606]|uniref:hypothetical protein n=1 Tax=Lactobacillus sp. CBA3606 TaxID=2099789 RepID=UPI000CFD79AD|nr:hypothetical protein [Lactobacillus sp. CBA3606]AVK64614.1 hypothetical protein C5Z26_11060 [Lactobacillus sp. CBA3606]
MKKVNRVVEIVLLITIVFGGIFAVMSMPVVRADTLGTSSTESIDDWMPDKALQQTVYTALHDLGQSVNSNGGYETTSIDQVTPKMLADIRYLQVDSTKITNLSGLQYATGLVQADFSGNTILKLPDTMPGGDKLYSLGLGSYQLTSTSPSWVLSSKISFKNTTSTYTDINYGFAGHTVSGTYTLPATSLNFSDDKQKVEIPFSSLFKGFKQADGSFSSVNPTVEIKFSSNDKLTLAINKDKQQIELDLSKVSAATAVQIQFSVNASENGSSYATWDTLSFNTPETDATVTDPMAQISPTEVANITALSKNNSNVVASKVTALDNYTINTMMTDTGIYSGYMTEDEKASVDTDTDMFNQITESAGLYLETLALRGDATGFDNYYAQVKKTFSNNDGSFYWMYNTRTKTHKAGNASLDDLRIMRALTIMQAKAPSDARATEIKELVAGFKKYSLLNGKMIDGTSFTDNTKEPAIRLCYLDMQELKYVYGEAGLSQKNYNDQLDVLEGGYLGDDFPYYQTYYYYGDMNGYKNGEYSTLPEAKGEVNSIDSLLIILHLAQVGKAKDASISWVKSHVHNRTLYNNYYTDGTPVEKNSAASSYAIAAMIASTVGDKEMYNDAVQDLNDSQVPSGYGDFSGCLGDIPSMKSATYNNLTGLLAYYY